MPRAKKVKQTDVTPAADAPAVSAPAVSAPAVSAPVVAPVAEAHAVAVPAPPAAGLAAAPEKKPRKKRVMKKGESELMSARGIGMQFVRKEITPEGVKMKKAECMKEAGSVYRALKAELEPLARDVAAKHPNPDGELTKEVRAELKKAREASFREIYNSKFSGLIKSKHAELKAVSLTGAQ